jgi:peptidyl-prolyl cis-trans isomerase B (cyclophilin B)
LGDLAAAHRVLTAPDRIGWNTRRDRTVARTKDRQRALARAKAERQIARRAAAARRKRQIQAGTAAGLALVLVVVGVLWQAGAFKHEKKKSVAQDCAWTNTPGTKDVGRPPTTKITKSGTQTMTITTNVGVIEAAIDVAKVPCTAASFTYLASKNYFDNTSCHRLTTEGAFILQCGDPQGDGKGGPGYRYKDENLPVKAPDPSADPSASPSSGNTAVDYPAGTLAMANSGADTNGSQFFIVYKDSKFDPKYTVLGTVTKGLDVVAKVGADGVDPSAENKGDGKPKTPVTIQSLTMSQPTPAAQPSASASTAPASGSAEPSASAPASTSKP